MATFDISVDWRGPEEGESVTPQTVSRGRLRIEIEDQVITANTRGGEHREFVLGSLAELADWFVEQWLSLNWDIRTPFEKVQGERRRELVFPSCAEAQRGWTGFAEEARHERTLAKWQHRHLIGHATSDLALPSVTVVPEMKHALVEVDASPFDSDVQFDPPANGYPTLHVVRKIEVLSEIEEFVSEVVRRGKEYSQTREWARWLEDRWDTRREAAENPEDRLATMLGPEWAEEVNRVAEDEPEIASGLTDLLVDCHLESQPNGEFELLRGLVEDAHRGGYEEEPWNPSEVSIESHLPVHEQGYRLAEQLRGTLDLGERPIMDLEDDVLPKVGADLADPVETRAFRTAFCSSRSGRDRIHRSAEEPRMWGLAGARFAIAAALGRMIAEKTSGANSLVCGGHGTHSRWFATKRANAFAIEFLLPETGIRANVGSRATDTEIQDLAEDYGVSRSAARWHAHNRGYAPRPDPESAR